MVLPKTVDQGPRQKRRFLPKTLSKGSQENSSACQTIMPPHMSFKNSTLNCALNNGSRNHSALNCSPRVYPHKWNFSSSYVNSGFPFRFPTYIYQMFKDTQHALRLLMNSNFFRAPDIWMFASITFADHVRKRRNQRESRCKQRTTRRRDMVLR